MSKEKMENSIYTKPELFFAHQLVERQATTSPDALAVSDGKQSLTFLELEQQANRLARHIKALGVGSETPVGLYFERSIHFVIAALAVLKAGGAYVPLDAAYPPARIHAILTDSGTEVLLSHRWMAASLPSGPWKTVDCDTDAPAIRRNSDGPLAASVVGSELAYIVYTSGSTGRPKGVEVTHANLLHLVEWHQRAFSVTAKDRASQVAGLAFDAAVWELWPNLCAGASLHLIDEASRRAPEALRDWLVRQKITIAFVPTILAEYLITLKWPRETALKVLLTGADTLHRYPNAALPFTLVNNYGPTECTVLVTSGPVSGEHASGQLPSIGRPIDDMQVLIMDANTARLQDGEEGEICIAGPQVARGYRRMPELTAERFVAEHKTGLRLYRTGDRGRLLPNGEIAFLGRMDDQIKIRGFRVEPDEIMAQLNSHAAIRNSTVSTRGEQSQEKALVAYLVLAPEFELTASELRTYLKSRLPDYMIPSMFVCVSSLPLTTSGKCDKQALPAPEPGNLLPQSPGPGAAAHVKGDGTQAVVSQLVSGLVDGRSIGPDDNFFLVGGHSLLAAQLIARLRETLNVSLNLRQLFEAPTISSLAAVVAVKLAS